MIIPEENHLAHYGILRKSGRYPWGSGANPNQRSKSFLDMVKDLRDKGLSDVDIAGGFGMSTTQLRDAKTIALSEKKLADVAMVNRLKFDRGLSNVAIGTKMGISEGSVRNLLAPGVVEKASILKNTADMLRRLVKKDTYIDIGLGVENLIGISSEKLRSAVAILVDEDYVIHSVQVPTGPNTKTTIKTLCPPGTKYKDVAANLDRIKSSQEFTDDGGRSFFGIKTPLSVNQKRIQVKYAEDGGADADGVIYVRPGIADLSLGGSSYAQVRIAVNGTHYLKGMALYKDDLPPGVDLQFNTNKADTGNKLDAMKKLDEKNPENPFGSMVRQIGKKNDRGEVVELTSAMNIVNEEGKWDTWSRNLSSQVLSKQNSTLARTQLDATYRKTVEDFEEIMSLTNPAVKEKLLNSFADDVDASAVHLKAAALPRQKTQVILPINSLKDTEIYAPNFKPGETVVLIRYPHGGTFEIPELTVTNKNTEARKIMGTDTTDAVGINSEVAKRLSGADFDGDTVLVIPNPPGAGRIKSTPALKDLQGFDPQRDYKLPEGQKFSGNKQKEMGDVSNLITDMTIRGARPEHIARAVKHSMVVIDAEKHDLDHKRSAQDNGILELKRKYQFAYGDRGASTLISKASARKDVPSRKERPASEGGRIDPATGKIVYVRKKPDYVDANGKVRTPTTTTKKLADTDDAHTLSSGTVIEKVYADHSNKLKALATQARVEMFKVGTTPYSPSAAKAYDNEVKTLDAKLNIALKNKPKERMARIIAETHVSAMRRSNPDMDKDEIKKLNYRALEVARIRTGAERNTIQITDREWAAIQAGAIRKTRMKDILNNTDIDKVKELATPRTSLLMSSAKTAQAERLLAAGYTQAEVAAQLGVGLTTLKKGLAGD